ncbi:DHHW family protein [Exiguobacterium sp. SH0S1]|uniref:DHHW family protein n=1 Tax=Exiguobacterium sp. SH0S1 TaxID=2510949 RepID=UPI0013761E91|nr:DHHW family protein [Exiguobacterium sp. SH0S1]
MTYYGEKRAMSVMENRELAAAPTFSIDSMTEGSYMRAFESFVTDQVVFRDTWIGLHAFFTKDVLQQSIKNGVYVADDGTMNSPIGVSTDPQPFVSDLARFATEMNAADVPIYFGLAPNKATFETYDSSLPEYMTNEAPAMYDTIKQEVSAIDNVSFIDYRTSLSNLDSLSEAFYKTDYHWNAKGAHYAYMDTIKAMQADFSDIAPPLTEQQLTTYTHDQPYYGSYARSTTLQYVKEGDAFEWFEPKAGFTPTNICHDGECGLELINTAPLASSEVYNELYTVFLHRNWPLLTIDQVTPKNDKRLLVLKDSYANPMLTLLPEHFGHISVIDVRHFNGETIRQYVEANEMDAVLFIHNVNLKDFIPLYHEKLGI